jgi:hypothetical protein
MDFATKAAADAKADDMIFQLSNVLQCFGNEACICLELDIVNLNGRMTVVATCAVQGICLHQYQTMAAQISRQP